MHSEVIRHVRFRQGIPAICTFAESHSQKGVRQQCTRCMHQLLSSWGSPPRWPGRPSAARYREMPRGQLSADARQRARSLRRFCGSVPGKTVAILASVDHRTRKTLTEQQHGDNGPPSPGTSTPSGQRQRAAPATSSNSSSSSSSSSSSRRTTPRALRRRPRRPRRAMGGRTAAAGAPTPTAALRTARSPTAGKAR